MRRPTLAILGLLTLLSTPLTASAGTWQDDPACQDHPAFTRMPHYYLRDKRFDCVETAFDAHRFRVGPKEEVTVEGRKLVLKYEFDRSGPTPSPLQIQRNYASAAKAAGGEVLSVGEDSYRELHAKLVKGEQEIWVHLRSLNQGGKVFLTFIEREAMRQDVVAKAETLASDLKATGKVAVHGIFFDTAMAELKPDSEAALVEMAKLLRADPALKVHIVGHTDSTGSFEDNLTLSKARAGAVVNALTGKHGIDAARLRAHGLGSLAPMASNRSEPGRAKNRRVEMVEQ